MKKKSPRPLPKKRRPTPEPSLKVHISSVDVSALLTAIHEATQKAKALKISLDAIEQAEIKVKVRTSRPTLARKMSQQVKIASSQDPPEAPDTTGMFVLKGAAPRRS